MVTLHHGDARQVLATMPDESVHCCVTSPPYFGLRSYLRHDDPLKPLEMGSEATPDEFVAGMIAVFREVRRVLRDDGTLWLNIGDTYNNNPSTSAIPRAEQGNGTGAFSIPGEKHHQANRAKANKAQPLIDAGIKKKDLIGIPWMLAFALRADGWFLRQDIIWSKPNPMPESTRDRCTKAHEYLFLLSKSARYHYDSEAISEELADTSVARLAQNVGGQAGSERVPGKINGAMKVVGGHGNKRNRRSVWTVATAPYREAHFATFPPALIEPCILAGCPAGGTVLDPFGGSGTTGMVAQKLGRRAVLIDLNRDYQPMMERRIRSGDIGLPLGAAA
jgi:DNA modification methylase